MREEEPYIALKRPTVVDRKDQDNVATSVVGFGEDGEVLLLGRPSALLFMNKRYIIRQ